jgi:GH15 family glucan-1,4-alpha-glucosidase
LARRCFRLGACGHPAIVSPSPPTINIGDYAFLSDCHSAVLVDRAGSIDWWCAPRFDSASIFGRLLGAEGGHWAIRPTAQFSSAWKYVGETLVLRTVHQTRSGSVAVTDGAALELGARGHELGRRSPHVLLRRVECLTGTAELEIDFSPRMEYGLTVPIVSAVEGGVTAHGGPVELRLTGPIPLSIELGRAWARFTLSAGESVEFRLAYQSVADGSGGSQSATIEDTVAGWESWGDLHEGYHGFRETDVARSALVLQGLTYAPTGAIIAAATTSLPERLGGDLNFDYRYAWFRDFALTIRALWIAACPDEADQLFAWIGRAVGELDHEHLQIMYGVAGERLLAEHELAHLPGFADSAPVRIGNAAFSQRQLDAMGEILLAARRMREHLDGIDQATIRLLIGLADRAASQWDRPDSGLWEARDAERHYVSSKAMCWAALDCAIELAPFLKAEQRIPAWTAAREDIREAILSKAWSQSVGAYAGAFGSDELDASVLLLPLIGFLPADDPRMWSTITAIERELGDGGLLRRWRSDDMGFLICSFWLVECLALGGEVGRAHEWFEAAAGRMSDVGLFSEAAALDGRQMLGNYPQAFSHVGFINAAARLNETGR